MNETNADTISKEVSIEGISNYLTIGNTTYDINDAAMDEWYDEDQEDVPEYYIELVFSTENVVYHDGNELDNDLYEDEDEGIHLLFQISSLNAFEEGIHNEKDSHRFFGVGYKIESSDIEWLSDGTLLVEKENNDWVITFSSDVANMYYIGELD